MEDRHTEVGRFCIVVQIDGRPVPMPGILPLAVFPGEHEIVIAMSTKPSYDVLAGGYSKLWKAHIASVAGEDVVIDWEDSTSLRCRVKRCSDGASIAEGIELNGQEKAQIETKHEKFFRERKRRFPNNAKNLAAGQAE